MASDLSETNFEQAGRRSSPQSLRTIFRQLAEQRRCEVLKNEALRGSSAPGEELLRGATRTQICAAGDRRSDGFTSTRASAGSKFEF